MTCTMRKTITLVVTAVGEVGLQTQMTRRSQLMRMKMSLKRMTMVLMHTMRAMTIIEAPTGRENSLATVVTPMTMTARSFEQPRRNSLRSHTAVVIVRAVLAAIKVRRCSSYPQACPPTRPSSTTTITTTEPHRAEAVVVVIIVALLTETTRILQPLQRIYP